MANDALGLTSTALDVVAVADKPINRSPLVVPAQKVAASVVCVDVVGRNQAKTARNGSKTAATRAGRAKLGPGIALAGPPRTAVAAPGPTRANYYSTLFTPFVLDCPIWGLDLGVAIIIYMESLLVRTGLATYKLACS